MSSSNATTPSITITNTEGNSRAISTNTFDAFLLSTHLTTMDDLAAAKQAKKDARNPVIVLKKSSKRVSDALKMKAKSIKTKSKAGKKKEESSKEEGFKMLKVVKVEHQ
ncbi:hypothetical protein COCC4DRAFT_35972 [Bipolaris maydis ATCC 48331]|uniref:Uncharacterized protein n=2 Tax=Cochliobolus heterostrophus TaxID=5016 RepID=M2TFQ2_COCH5|nr:uncharacterized protein COCC4DRAFT_35972 [Bipolaris maydis ATCC 48331]EMD96280.1 hypothetical protein COCHEDRAFT_1152342 [Bipolaris maydis C5]ENI11139.1 hypothetical protein COCC4DRAFT_35972 [Bipolaris maydis ATCC 48331]KAH7562114.1 hypothetical protein BM1_03218 [Bipolaris maydis]